MELFLYGTLRHPALFDLVAGPGAARAEPAVLPGHALRRVAGQGFPMVVPDPDAQVEGVLLRGLSAAQRARLDLYEQPYGYRAVPREIVLADGTAQTAAVYLPPDGLNPDGDWSLADWVAREGAVACHAAAEIFAHDPPLSGEDLARQWPMVLSRAHARARAEAQHPVTTVRRAAGPGDVTWTPVRPLAGTFFKLATMRVGHLRFDGTRAEGLIREVLIGADAALVLPYDPVRDRVLLLEQVRSGPMRRGDPAPWCLEPVAGIVDAGETPDQAARRECVEEAHLTPQRLVPMFAGYASPGSTTDHFYCFLGLCDLPDGHATRGGLDEEGEDLRLHLLDTDAALDLIGSGEITVTPLIAMLLWLARARPGLRAAAGSG